MIKDIAVKIKDLTKIYKLYNKPVDRLKEALHPFKKKYYREFYALKNLNFSVNKGETVGIIGKNGSGKSTLLKIITGVLTPTGGTITVDGNISALLELGTGFNPELTGIENIYFSGTIMGYDRIEEKIDEIIAFADIGDFINQPVKTYSSGMYVRLGFAVAINVDPEILIIDEALSVGDMRFQQKCFRKLKEFRDNNKTILFVSHDPGTIINFCDRAIWLMNGEVYNMGEPKEIVKKYVSYMSYDSITSEGEVIEEVNNIKNNASGEIIEWDDVASSSSFGDGGAKITGVALYGKKPYRKVKVFEGREPVIFFVEIEAKSDIYSPIYGFVLNDEYGNHILGMNNSIYGIDVSPLHNGDKVIVKFEFNFPDLKNGYYSFSPAIAEGTIQSHTQQAWVHDTYVIQVVNNSDKNKMGWYFIIDHVNIEISTT